MQMSGYGQGSPCRRHCCRRLNLAPRRNEILSTSYRSSLYLSFLLPVPCLHRFRPAAAMEEVSAAAAPDQQDDPQRPIQTGIVSIPSSAPASSSLTAAARIHGYRGSSGLPRLIFHCPAKGIVQLSTPPHLHPPPYPCASVANTSLSSSGGRLPPLLPLCLPPLLPGMLLPGGTIPGHPTEAIFQ